jgi:ATP-dependent RNA helicase DDX3X
MSDNGDAFSIEAMNDALEAIKDLKGVQAAGPPADTDEAKAKARAHGFVLPTAYDYSLYERGPTALGPEGDDENATMPPREWASNAARYEFEDEYGDIGPRVPELEEQLFKAPTIVRTGIHMSKLHFRVKLEGPEQIKSIEKVTEYYVFKHVADTY